MKFWPFFGLKLRSKLLLVSLVILLIPWLGVRYIQAVEGLLQQQQAQAMATIAKASAVLVAQYPKLFAEHLAVLNKPNTSNKIAVTSHSAPTQIDGYQDEWLAYTSLRHTFRVVNKLSPKNTIDPQDLTVRYIFAQHRDSLTMLLDVVDDSIVFRDPRKRQRHGGDAIVLAVVDAQQRVHRYLLSASTFGQVNAYEFFGSYLDPVIINHQSAIKAAWQRSPFGYRLELSLPLSMFKQSLALAVIDVDNGETSPQVLGLGDVRDRALFTDVLLPSKQLATVLAPMATEGVRLWLVDDQSITIASAGQGDVMIADAELNSLSDLFYQLFLQEAVSDDESISHEQAVLAGNAVKAALKGQAETERRIIRDDGQMTIVAAQPVLIDGNVIGAVVVEQNTNAILELQNQAVKTLLNTMMLVFSVMVMTLIGFASRLSFRIKRLNYDVATMVSGEGRVAGNFVQGIERDELGELRQSFAKLFDRLTLYTDYLEALASRLAHELRTPIAVITTSLEHLEQTADNRQIYIDRARSGSERLSSIVARMSEASRLEQSVTKEVLREFNLQQLLTDIIPVYRDIYSDVEFDTDINNESIMIKGSQDLLVQMLDKLLGNAVDFHQIDTPVLIALRHIKQEKNTEFVQIIVRNNGVSLLEKAQQQLFQPMVSIRPVTNQATVPHLGLGLYIVRLIVDKHDGKVIARNWQQGVEFCVELPITTL
ncbi:MAG: two-component system sensor histidine kinase ChvG [Methylophagaceae bacterium]|jgi:two-component system sensor histidine kinase ChvG